MMLQTLFQLRSSLVKNTRNAKYSSKVFPSSAAAVSDIVDNSSILFGGFGLCGTPENLVRAILEQGSQSLTMIGNDVGCADFGIGTLLDAKMIKKIVTSYVGEHKNVSKYYNSGEVELHLNPQGNLAEKIRCGGAGIPAFYTPTGVGTVVQTGQLPIKFNSDKSVAMETVPKETRNFGGREYVLEEAITADFACIKAWKGDKHGNLVFRSTARNINPDCAKAARIAIAEVEELVEVGVLTPDEIHLPGIYVDRVVLGEAYEKPIERLRASEPIMDAQGVAVPQDLKALPPPSEFSLRAQQTKTVAAHHHVHGGEAEDGQHGHKKVSAERQRIARRAALEFSDGMYVNIGIGIPTLSCNYIPPSVSVILQSENGLLGMGPFPQEGFADPDLVNASKEPVSYLPGSSTFSTADSFAMIRSGNIDLTVLGALELSAQGDLASWIIPGGALKGMGGAMDLLAGCQRVVATTTHMDKFGKPKINSKCALPLTGKRVVSMIITELAVFTVDLQGGSGLTLVEHAEGVTVEEIRNKTGAPFKVSSGLTVMKQ